MADSRRFIRFISIGILASVVDIGLLYMLTAYLGIWYLLSATVSYCCGIVVSYILNKFLTFHDTDRHYLSQFSAFAAISLSCLLVNICIIGLCVEVLAVGYLPAKVIATAGAFFWNYYGQSRITFHSP